MKGVEVGARRAVPGAAAGDQSRHGAPARSKACRRASPPSAFRRRGSRMDQREAATAAGYTVVDATTALSTHLSEIIRSFLPELLSRQQVKEMVDSVAQTSPKLVEELVPKLVSLGEIQRVLRQLLRERVPVRDLATILEAMADAAASTKDWTRSPKPCAPPSAAPSAGLIRTRRASLPVIGVAPMLEERLLASLVRTEQGAVLALDPQQAQTIAVAHRARRSNRPWHSLCCCARQRCGLICGGCSRECCRTWACCRTTRCPRTCRSSRSRPWTDMHFKRYRRPTVREALQRRQRGARSRRARAVDARWCAARGLSGLVRTRASSRSRQRRSGRACRTSDRTSRIAPVAIRAMPIAVHATSIAARLQAERPRRHGCARASPRTRPAKPRRQCRCIRTALAETLGAS